MYPIGEGAIKFNDASKFSASASAVAVAVAVAVVQLKGHLIEQTIDHLSKVNHKVTSTLKKQFDIVMLDGKKILLEQEFATPIQQVLQGNITAESQLKLRRTMAQELFPRHYQGFYIINKSKTIVGSMKDSDYGRRLPATPASAIQRLDQGQQGIITHAFSFNQQLEMWMLTPISTHTGKTIGYLALILGNQHKFSATTLLTGVASDTMETYLVNEQGYMLSESRFIDQLVATGRLKKGEKTTLNIRLINPQQQAMSTNRSNNQAALFTFAVKQVLQNHRDGLSATPYESYHGLSVMGVWQWDKLLNAAIITEISTDDAMDDYYFTRNLLILLVVIIIFGAWTAARFYSRLRVRAERASNRHRNLLLKSTAEAIYGIDLDGCCTFVNQSFLNMLGYEEDEVIGKNMHSLIHHSRVDASPLAVEDCHIFRAHKQRTKVHRNDECFWRKDGTAIRIEYWAQPIFEEDMTIGSVVTFLDISEKLKAEHERNQLEKQVQHAQRLESLGVLAGGIAHDFNNLLAAILGNASLVDAGILKDPLKAKERNARIIQATERAGVLCKQMLAYSGKGQFVLNTVDISAIVDEMTHLLEVSIDKSVVIKYHLTKNLPLTLVDEAQIQQVIMNLITNANEAIGSKSGVISLTTGMMHADESYLLDCYGDKPAAGRYIYVEVSDTGCGMDKATIDKIFDPFFTTKVTGRGLGMSAILGIVRGHKGALKIYSELGRGTTFKFLLPVDESSKLSLEQHNASPTEHFHGGTVLVVDDEETVREMACAILEDMGFATLSACNGEEGLAAYQQYQDSITLVLTDLTMPRMAGNELYSALKKINPDCHVILSSGYNSQDAIQQFSGKGLAGFVQKPFTPDTLAKEIRKVLGDKA